MPFELEALRSLLLREWDPLGLFGREGAEHHYDAYAGKVLEMIAHGSDAAAVANYLSSVVTIEFGLAADLACDRAVAAKAAGLR